VNTLILAAVQKLLRRHGYAILPESELRRLKEKSSGKKSLWAKFALATKVMSAISPGQEHSLLGPLVSMRSQLGQDVFALWASGMRRDGFFVEFGAGDGVFLSNTYLLEKEFGWTGILAEPHLDYHDSLRRHRTAKLEPLCVWSASGESFEFVSAGYLSTLAAFRDSDFHAKAREGGAAFTVQTISLVDLLDRHGAPRVIDFLSIDTEGSEYEILSAFPFGGKYTVRAIACEHNYTSRRSELTELLLSKGYEQIGANVSKHDDWFVLAAK